MSKTATITEIEAVKPWESKYGTMYGFDIVLDNGDEGQVNKKSSDALKVGDTITYNITPSDYGNKIKEVFENRGGKTSRGFNGSKASFALSYAKDIAVASIAASGNVPANTTKQVTDTAEKFYQWRRGS
jgi:hypothetical protein